MIRKMFPGQPMEKSGKFMIGDVILIINDQIMDGLSHQEALSVIRNAPRCLKIVAKRPKQNEIPMELFMNSRPVSPEKLMKDLQSNHLKGTLCKIIYSI